jgi:hypothetical protein
MTAVEEAECRLVEARNDVHYRLSRARTRLRQRLTHPITLVSVAGITAVLVYWFTGRKRRTSPIPIDGDRRRTKTRTAWPIIQMLFGVAMRALPFVLWRLRLAQSRQDRSADQYDHPGHGPQLERPLDI